MGDRRGVPLPPEAFMDVNERPSPNEMHELLFKLGEVISRVRPLITTTHESLPDGWGIEEGLADLLRSITGEREDQRKIAEMGLQVVCMLLAKNRQYGNAALDPLRVFASNLSARDMISVRMDDKISRIQRGSGDDDEDPRLDLVGYGILDLIARHDERT